MSDGWYIERLIPCEHGYERAHTLHYLNNDDMACGPGKERIEIDPDKVRDLLGVEEAPKELDLR